MTVATSIMTGGMVAGAVTGVASATAGAEAAACAGAGDSFAGTDVEPGIPAAGTGQQTIKFSMSPTRGPAYANGPAAKGGKAKDKEAIVAAITKAMLAGDTEALKAAIPSKTKPHKLIAIMKSAVKAADKAVNGAEIVKKRIASHLSSYSGYVEENNDRAWTQAARMLNEQVLNSPELAQAFWTQMNETMSNFDDFEFWENADNNVPNYFAEDFKGDVRKVMIAAFVDHIIATPRSRCIQWAQEAYGNIIWEDAITILTERLEAREITAKIFADLQRQRI